MESLLDLFAARVAETPDATALVFAGERMTFTQLDREANRVAQYVAGRGLGPEDLVGLRMDRGFEMAVGALGVLKSGAACLPLDPVYPSDLVAWMGADAGVSLVLTNTTEVAEDVRLGDAVAGQPEHAPDVELRPGNLAYVMYTSGSSGKPKPVGVEHRHLAHVFAAWDELFRLREEPLTFVSVIGIGSTSSSPTCCARCSPAGRWSSRPTRRWPTRPSCSPSSAVTAATRPNWSPARRRPSAARGSCPPCG